MLKIDLGLDFWRTSCLWRKTMEISLGEVGITHPQFVVLYNLKRHCDSMVSQRELAGITNIDTATLSQIVRLLEKKNMLKRKHIKGDERSKYLRLTNEGHAILNQAIEKYHQANLNFFDPDLIDLAYFQKNLLKLSMQS